MLYRIISSLIILPGFIALMLWDQQQWFRAFVVVSVCLAWLEFRGMAAKKNARPSLWLGLPFVVGYLLLSLQGQARGGEWLDHMAPAREALLIGFVVAAALRHVVMEDQRHGLNRLLVEIVGGIYLALFGSFMLRLHTLPEGGYWVLLVFFFAWVYDSGAYFVGKTMGKTPFSAWSPKKTWEGFWGGLAVAAAVAWLVVPAVIKVPGLEGWRVALLAVVAGGLAQLGDLLESMFKRWAGVKDSSTLIGQHGGFLDKLDSSMFVAPLVYGAALWWGLGGPLP